MILTKYVGPTNHNPGRVIARSNDQRAIVQWDHALGVIENHEVAAKAVAAKTTKAHDQHVRGDELQIQDWHAMPDWSEWAYAWPTKWERKG